MKTIEPSYKILQMDIPELVLTRIERAGRTCYKSEEKITPESADKFVRTIIKSGHESVIEHENISVLFVCDRGVTHELVRHRLASYSQESTRYCNYSKDKFGYEITVIKPLFWEEGTEEYNAWTDAVMEAEASYMDLIKLGAKPQEARSVLPNSLKTEIVATANLREWRHILRLRCSKKAHPQIRQIMRPLLKELKQALPAVFEDITY